MVPNMLCKPISLCYLLQSCHEHEGYHKLQQNMNHLNSHHTHKVNTYKDPNDHNMKNWNTKWNEQDYDAKLCFN